MHALAASLCNHHLPSGGRHVAGWNTATSHCLSAASTNMSTCGLRGSRLIAESQRDRLEASLQATVLRAWQGGKYLVGNRHDGCKVKLQYGGITRKLQQGSRFVCALTYGLPRSRRGQ